MAIFKILVVDDEAGIRSGVARILRNFTVDYPFMDEMIEFEVVEAPTGEDALHIINSNAIDIMLLDNKLPGMQGVEVLEQIKKQQLDIIVVMITSYASLELAVKATKDGAFDFIPKPFTPQELRSSIENITKQLFLKRMTRKLNTVGKQFRFQFLQVLSHELKAPLNAIEGYLKIIQEKQLGDNIDDYNQIINRSMERINGMSKLILDLLDFTKVESGKTTKEIYEIDIVKIAINSIDAMKPYSIQKDVQIKYNFPEKAMIQADADDIEIMFNNLISNAIKYNIKNGKVYVEIKDFETSVQISVKDDGIGISDENLPKLFKEFSRIKDEKTKNISGTGLGLSIIKRIIDFYQGKISVNSKIDSGTIFNISIPKQIL